MFFLVHRVYMLLIGGLSQVKQSRLQQLVDWCGSPSEFDGCLIFDECHKAKHFVPVCTLFDIVTSNVNNILCKFAYFKFYCCQLFCNVTSC